MVYFSLASVFYILFLMNLGSCLTNQVNSTQVSVPLSYNLSLVITSTSPAMITPIADLLHF